MKKIIVMSCVVFATTFHSIAQDNSPAAARANHLTDKMIRDLRLNNFQANKLRAINQEKISKIAAFETEFANDPTLVDKNCKGVCKERDRELQSFLSAEQYSKYYASRNQYNKADRDFAAQIGARPTLTADAKVKMPIGDKVVTGGSKTQTFVKADE